ncbi:SUMO1 sentrin specific peptidase 1 [Apophysomyces sp. BC1034]|nr:SUMO1 sentrin specific peptidase 1 [Apophysomyces sp. BC1015]KAG0170209.1 SUMO1 sentrin specific peptidase 1 [Apophysomyces sp. BC1021]KAG0184933.1 SUMO1 sentrin specific peptidase 1 [Apophysomyces sp. BC1034]
MKDKDLARCIPLDFPKFRANKVQKVRYDSDLKEKKTDTSLRLTLDRDLPSLSKRDAVFSKRSSVTDADPFRVSLLCCNMYERYYYTNQAKDKQPPTDCSPSEDGIPENDRAPSPTTKTTTVIILDSDDDDDEDLEDSMDSVLNQLQGLSLEKSQKPARQFQKHRDEWRKEILRTKGSVLDLYDTFDIPKRDKRFEELYTKTAAPKPKPAPLTPEEEKLVDSFLRQGQHGLIAQIKTAVVEYKDIYKLYPETWLNDEVDIFAKDLVFVPINQSYHWTLGVIDMKKKLVEIYDSMGGGHDYNIKLLLKYLSEEHMDKKKAPLDMSEWKSNVPKDIPRQKNMSDCGVFTCTFAEHLSRQQEFDFTQEDMITIRRRMVLDIIQKKLSL